MTEKLAELFDETAAAEPPAPVRRRQDPAQSGSARERILH
jgi:hypothetical protein